MISLLNAEKGNISSASSGSTAGFASTSGSTFVICVSDPNANVTISDNKGNSYSQVGTDQLLAAGTGNVTGQMWQCPNGAGGAGHTATVTFTSGTGDCAFYFLEIGDAANPSIDSGSISQGTDASTPFERTTGTLAQADSLIVAFAFNNDSASSFTAASPLTTQLQETNVALYWTSAVATGVVASTAAVTASFTCTGSPGTGGLGLIVAAFKQAGAPIFINFVDGGNGSDMMDCVEM